MLQWIARTVLKLAVLAVVLLALGLGARAAMSLSGPRLQIWHTYVPPELSAEATDRTDWDGYRKAEDALFAATAREMQAHMPESGRTRSNRYFEGSPVFPAHFAQDWNRSFVLQPDGPPKGAAVFLHGMTDAPYSLRHIAQRYRDLGYVAIGLRLPGHGTVPGGLTTVTWEEWMAATRLAVREARRREGPGKPLHLVGYSNGGALAVKYALDALADRSLPKPDRLVLVSPMIGLSPLAALAGIAAWPSVIPGLEATKWLSVLPEYNPFKYTSFPVNAAVQAHRMSTTLQHEVAEAAQSGRIASMPPILAFQSVADFTVSTKAVIDKLFERLPGNGSELVLFDLNHAATVADLFTPSAPEPQRLLTPAPRRWRATVIGNASPTSLQAVARSTEPGGTQAIETPLPTPYPAETFSLSHVAMPFPPNDGLYGLQPDPADDFGVQLGNMAPRGETGLLAIGLDTLMRNTSNPFFGFMLERIEDAIPR